MKKLVSTNPARNYEPIGSISVTSLHEIKQKVRRANHVKTYWKELGIEKRISYLRKVYDEFTRKKGEIALVTTMEMGKPIKESLEDIEWDLSYFKSFLENGPKYLMDEVTYKDKKSTHKIVYEPIGTAAVIVPWNYPFSMFVWGVIPNLIAGNTVVFKHSEECPLTGKLIEDIMKKVNLPSGVFSEIYGDGKIGEELIHQDIDFIWFTGSSAAGKKIYKLAGKKFIKSVLEMGGSNPAVVFPDIDLDQVVEKIYVKRFMNCGQACDALKRAIIHVSIFNEFVEKLKGKVEQAVIGDPQNKKTTIGPLVAKRQLDLLESQIEDAKKKGAKIIIGGKKAKNLKGAFYMPTIITNVKKNMRVWKEETFGPALIVVPFKTEEEAIKLANDTPYGLGAQIYTLDQKKAARMAGKINAGTIDINFSSHWLPSNPFGGYKESGMGREHGKVGFHELCQIKVIASD